MKGRASAAGYSLIELATVVSLIAVVLLISTSIIQELTRDTRRIEAMTDFERLSFELLPLLRADLDRATTVQLQSQGSVTLTVDGDDARLVVYRIEPGAIERIETAASGSRRRRVAGKFSASFTLRSPASGGQPLLRLEVLNTLTNRVLLSFHRRLPGRA